MTTEKKNLGRLFVHIVLLLLFVAIVLNEESVRQEDARIPLIIGLVVTPPMISSFIFGSYYFLLYLCASFWFMLNYDKPLEVLVFSYALGLPTLFLFWTLHIAGKSKKRRSEAIAIMGLSVLGAVLFVFSVGEFDFFNSRGKSWGRRPIAIELGLGQIVWDPLFGALGDISVSVGYLIFVFSVSYAFSLFFGLGAADCTPKQAVVLQSASVRAKSLRVLAALSDNISTPGPLRWWVERIILFVYGIFMLSLFSPVVFYALAYRMGDEGMKPIAGVIITLVFTSMLLLFGKRLNLRQASLTDEDLSGVTLSCLDLKHANLTGTNLSEADLSGADLDEAILDEANLQGTTLLDIKGQPKSRQGCVVDYETYRASQWDDTVLLDWCQHGAVIEHLSEFPEETQDVVLGTRQGLTLHFNSKLTTMNRFLIEGAIITVLGRETDCSMVEFKQLKNTARVRLEASSSKDLERVAEALHDIAWEREEEARQQEKDTQWVEAETFVKTGLKEAALQFSEVLAPEMRQAFNEIVDQKLERMLLYSKDMNILGKWEMPIYINKGTIIHNEGQLAGLAVGDGAHVELYSDVTQSSVQQLSSDTINAKQFKRDSMTARALLRGEPNDHKALSCVFGHMISLNIEGKSMAETRRMVEELCLKETGESFEAGLEKLDEAQMAVLLNRPTLGALIRAVNSKT